MSLSSSSKFQKVRKFFNEGFLSDCDSTVTLNYHRLLEYFYNNGDIADKLNPHVRLLPDSDINTLVFELFDTNIIPREKIFIFLENPSNEEYTLVRDYSKDTSVSLPPYLQHLAVGKKTNTDMPIIYLQRYPLNMEGDDFGTKDFRIDTKNSIPCKAISLEEALGLIESFMIPVELTDIRQ